MKKINLTLILASILMISVSYADEFTKKDFAKASYLSFYMEDEAEADDIPFNTAKIVAQYKLNIAPIVIDSSTNSFDSYKVTAYPNIDRFQFDFIEETESDDIPFNTYQLYKEFNILNTLNGVMYTLEDEEEVTDIPFNTEEIVKSLR